MRIRLLLILAVAIAGLVGLAAWLGGSAATSDGPGPGSDRPERDRASPPARPGRSSPDPVRSLRGRVRRGDPPEGGASVEAILLVRGGGPGDGPDPYLGDLDDLPHFRTTSAPDGSFRLDGLPPGFLELSATAADGATAARFVRLGPEGPAAPAELALARGDVTLRGRAVHADGRPFRGEIRLLDGRPLGLPLPGPAHRTRTDADGAFRLEVRAPRMARLLVLLAGGRHLVGPLLDLPGDDDVRFVVDEGLVERAGRVIAAGGGGPIDGASVQCVCEGAWRLVTNTRTGPDGRFRVATRGGGGRFRVEARGFDSWNGSAGGRPGPVEIVLARLSTVAGRVLHGGEPVPDVPVRLFVGGRTHETRSGPDGRYVLTGVESGDHEIVAWGGGWAPRSLVNRLRTVRWQDAGIRLEPGVSRERDLEVVPAARIRGRVRTRAGEPAEGVEVVVAVPSPDYRRMGRDDPFRTTTDPDGRFVLDSLLPASTVLEVRDRTVPVGGAGPVFLAGGETREVVVTVVRPRRISVSTIDGETGRPVEGVELRWAPRGTRGGWGPRRGRVVTDGGGRAEVGPVGAMPVRIDARREGYLRDREGTVLERPEPVTVTLQPGRVLAGRVLLPASGPAAGALVAASQDRLEVGRAALSAPDGSFRIEGLWPGPVKLEASHGLEPEILEIEVETEAGREDVVLRLAPRAVAAGSLLVRIRGPGGETVFEAEAILLDLEGRELDRAGGGWIPPPIRLERGEGAPDRCYVLVTGTGGTHGRPLPFGAAVHGPVAADETEIEVELPPERTIEGRIVNAAGEPVPRAHLFADPILDGLGSVPDGGSSASTGADGRFRLHGLGDFRHLVRVAADGAYRPLEPHELRAGARGVTFVLLPAATATITVLDADGAPVRGAWVGVRVPGSSEEAFSGPTGREGAVRTERLDPDGRYVLRVRAPSHRLDLFPERLERWRPADTTVTLERGLVLVGRVVDPDGKALPGASVGVSVLGDAPPRARGRVEADADGSFRIGPLRPGRIALVGAPAGGTLVPGLPEMIVDAGTDAVTLVVAPGLELEVRAGELAPRGDPEAVLSLEGEGGVRRVAPRDGRFRFVGLPPGSRGTLLVRCGGLCALRRDLGPADSPVRVELAPARTVRGRIAAAEGVRVLGVRLELMDHHDLVGSLEGDGGFVVEGVPPGRFPVIAVGSREGRRVEARAEVEAGGTVILELR